MENKIKYNPGDELYIKTLPPSLIELGTILIKLIRNILPNGDLELLQKRSFKEKINYYTLKPQPRVNNIFITVHGNPNKFKKYTNIYDLKKDRPGYSGFRISNINQLESTIDIIRQAIKNKES